MVWIYLIIGTILFLFFAFLNTPNGKGLLEELKINSILKRIAKKIGGIEIRDLMIEDSRSSSQIDNLLLTQKALYVIEAKNYGGMIFGSEDNMNWTVTVKHVNKKTSKSGKIYKKIHISKHKFYNPIKQNKTHINKIKNLVTYIKDFPIYNIVVFGNRAHLKDITHSSKSIVINRSKLYKTIINLDKDIDLIDDNNQQAIYDDLVYFNILDKKQRKMHVSNIKNKYKK